MKKFVMLFMLILLCSYIFGVTTAEEEPVVEEITNPDIFGVWQFDTDASQKAAISAGEKKYIRNFTKLTFYFQEDGTVEMASGEVANFTQVSDNTFEIDLDEAILVFTLSEGTLYAEIPMSETKTIYPVFTKHSNN